ncbi:CsbD family protein [Mesorhizobium sp. AR07]|uniref:CsbD family protein n=1 Tax=Mesorhizobium sp. AR07 TaxID=2865838 RepID=UPI00215DD904|nr:CsbD family protein [Mesorhizobium sp. AR07]UVK46693.1 CsbD family protein [Mesorhizobium sp. AR07]
MGSTSDKAKGLANQAVGDVKQGVGKAVGNDRLRAEGAAQEAKGKVQKAVGDVKGAAKDATNKAAAAINKNL